MIGLLTTQQPESYLVAVLRPDQIDLIADAVVARSATNSVMRKALERIARWHGEFPDAPDYIDNRGWSRQQTYGAAYGCNGERDFMRTVACTALNWKED